jgi:serine/threonine-protein phosphatase 4 regulatory subunit 1
LAYSLHELAQILTVEQVEEDLCPVFDSFCRDVDEVKIGILSHLAQFLKVLPLTTRRNYLDKLTYLTSVDNQRNWGFRLESAKYVPRQ